MPNIKMRNKETGVTFTVPENKKDDMEYLDKAHSLAQDINQPIFKPKTGQGEAPIRFGKGLLQGAKDAILSPLMMGPLGAAVDAYQGLSELPTAIKNFNDPNYQAGQEVAARENIRNLPGVSDVNRIMGGDYAGEIGNLLPQVAATILGISPKARAGAMGAAKGIAESPIQHIDRWGPAGLAGGALGAAVNSHSNPYLGFLTGSSVGGVVPQLATSGINAIKGGAKAFNAEPRAFNWSPYPMGDMPIGDIPMQSGPRQWAPMERFSPVAGDIRPEGISGRTGMQNLAPNPVYNAEFVDNPSVTYPNPNEFFKGLPPSNVRNAPGGFSPNVPEQMMADYPARGLPAPEFLNDPYNMPAAGTNNLVGQTINRIPAPGPAPRSMGGIASPGRTMADDFSIDAINKRFAETPKALPAPSNEPLRSRGGIIQEGGNQKPGVVERTRNATKSESTPSKKAEAKPSESKAPETKAKNEVNTITSPETLPANPGAFTEEGVNNLNMGQLSRMTDTASMAAKEGIPYQEMQKRLAMSGIQTISDFEYNKRLAAFYGLTERGSKLP